jgi:hypothetical protein
MFSEKSGSFELRRRCHPTIGEAHERSEKYLLWDRQQQLSAPQTASKRAIETPACMA